MKTKRRKEEKIKRVIHKSVQRIQGHGWGKEWILKDVALCKRSDFQEEL